MSGHDRNPERAGARVGHPLEIFDQIRIINLADRSDRRREMMAQLEAVGGMSPQISFFEARRPTSMGEFPSIGARGCFESHLEVLREAEGAGVSTLLILEDDFDFSRSRVADLQGLLAELEGKEWSIFYGAHQLPVGGRRGLVTLSAEEGVMTTSFVAMRAQVIAELIDFLERMSKRPAGSPDYGPMHVDGAYSVFRKQNPKHLTVAAFPPLGLQRSSRSDVTPRNAWIDHVRVIRDLFALCRQVRNKLRS